MLVYQRVHVFTGLTTRAVRAFQWFNHLFPDGHPMPSVQVVDCMLDTMRPSGGSSQGSGINYQHDKQKTMRIGCEKIIHIYNIYIYLIFI